MTSHKLVGRVVVFVWLFVCSLVQAQTPIEPPVINPGARSLALGGAFVAVADDATAAYANPSGLVQLLRPEISVELRAWSDDRVGVASDLSGLGFASFVLPRKRWSLAFYGQTLASVEFPVDSITNQDVFIPLSTLTIASAGVSAAVRLSDALSVGLGIGLFVGSSTEIGVDSPFRPTFFPTDDTSNDSGVIAGGLWSLSDAWALGASYRSGTDFRFSSGRQATLPDVLAAGARWRSAGGHATVAVEVERLTGIDDRTRLHVGGEWVFLSAKPLIGLRAGLWRDPNDGVAARETENGPSSDEGATHVSAGAGVAFKKFQIDLGIDSSEKTAIASISVIITF